MRIQIIAVGKKMPGWVQAAYQEYAKRFPRDFKISLTEISPAKRTSTQKNIHPMVEDEGQQILKSIQPKTITVALAVEGSLWTSEQLAAKLDRYARESDGVNFLIGGPDGLSSACLKRSEACFSLSPLTFPHPLVRVILIEQLYRAFTILSHHPYHRF